MSERVLKKVRHEVGCLWVILGVSLAVSSAMISDAARSFSANGIFEFGLIIFMARMLEFVAGIFWLLLTLRVMRELLKIRERRKNLFLLRGVVRAVDEEISGIMRDLIAFYRGYYGEIRILLMFLFLTGLVMIASEVYAIYLNAIAIEEFLFLLSMGILTLVYSLATLWYISERWGKKLFRIKNEEKILSDFLGEAC
jgi:hypothetical protein